MKQVYPEIPLAQTIVNYCASKRIYHIVISPGSRNAPLIQGFTANKSFTTYSIIDERSAAFFALGIAQQLKHPVAVVCTSGSALLNFYPAVSEAFYNDIPLVVISADRLPHQIDIGDGQTIRQAEVFEPHIEASGNLNPDVIHSTPAILKNPNQKLIPLNSSTAEIEQIQNTIQIENERLLNKVLNIAISKSGPVHLNVPLEEPLYGTTDITLTPQENTNIIKEQEKINWAHFVPTWSSAIKKIILIGQLPPNSISDSLIEFWVKDPSILVLTEKTSNMQHPRFINSIDVLIAPIENENDELLKQLQPDLLISIGGMIISKKIKKFLRYFSPNAHWHINPKKAYNTFYVLSEHVPVEPQYFFEGLQNHSKQVVMSDFNSKIHSLYSKHRLAGIQYLKQIPFSDLKAFEIIFRYLPKHCKLQLSNSSIIRYAQLFDLPKMTEVFCNRGTSGIDGSTSTAVGAAFVSKKPTVLITGDLSFFYDINALWNEYWRKDFKVIIINNQGGGIFRILPGQKDTPTYDKYYETVHKRTAKYVCKSFDIGYTSVKSERRLKRKLKTFFSPLSDIQVMEVFTPRKRNDEILLNYFRAMQ